MNNSELNSLVIKKLEQRQQVQELARGYRKAQILFTCIELGVFDALAGGSATSQKIAEKTQTSTRGMDLLLNAAVALGLLEKNDSNFSNSPLTEPWLIHGSDVGISQSLLLEKAFYTRWGYLAEAVRSGNRPEENRRDEQPQDWVRNLICALYNSARLMAPIIAEALALPEDRPIRAIDVGGGHGGYSIALAQRYPLLTATIFELPRVVPIAREIIANAGMSDRVTVQEGDFQKEGLGSGYDIALVFGVLNGEPPEGRPALINKVFSALNTGGQIVLRDFVLEPDRSSPLDSTIFALQMLLATESGGLDTRDDWINWLLSAGFSHPKQVALPEWVGSFLTVAVKLN